MRPLRQFLLPALAVFLALSGCDKSTDSPVSAPQETPRDGLSFAKALILRTDDSTVWASIPAKAETLWTRFDAIKGLTYRWTLTGTGIKDAILFGEALSSTRSPAPGKEGFSMTDSVMSWRCDSTQVVYLPLIVLDSLAKVGIHGRPEIGGVAMDAWEPELSASDRHRLPWDSLTTRTLTTDDTDWFVLPTIDSGSLEFTAEGCNGAVLEWFDRNGTLVGSGTLGKSAYGRSLRLGRDSAVLLRVRQVFGGSTGSYNVLAKHGYPLRPDPYDPDEGGWFTGPEPKDTLVLDAAPHKRSLAPRENDYAVLWADSGKDYQITARSNRPLEMIVFTPSVNGSRSGNGRDGGRGSWLNGIIRFTAKKTGYFRLDINAETYGDSSDYSLEFKSAAPLGADAKDPADDVRSGAQQITLDAWSGGTLLLDDVDWYKAAVSAGKTYVLTYQGEQLSTLKIWKESDTLSSITSNAIYVYPTDSIWFTADSNRVVQFQLRSSQDPQQYRIKLSELTVLGKDSQDPDSSIATATLLDVDSSARTSGTLSLGDVDVYKIPCDSGMKCTVTYWGPEGTSMDWIDANGKTVSVSSWFGNLGVPNPTAMNSYTATATGVVYIRLHSNKALTPARGPYTLRLSRS